MKFKLFKTKSIKGLFLHLLVAVLLLVIISTLYFTVYLNSVTNHGKYVVVPNLKGISLDELPDVMKKSMLRYNVSDSAYSSELPPYTVISHYPDSGAHVKKNRIILITINQSDVPTMPMPDLVDHSLIHAKAVLVSNELILGKTHYVNSPYKDLVISMQHNDSTIEGGMRISKGSVIDLYVGIGSIHPDITLGKLIGDSYERALFKLQGWNLRLGKVTIPEEIDTTEAVLYVFKQHPAVGDSIKTGSPVDLWIAPKEYHEIEE